MKKWHETLAANIGLRAGGIILLAIGWLLALRLHHMAQSIGSRDMNSLMILLSAATFLCASAGSALLFVGPGLWESVEVSERWRRLSPWASNAAFSAECDPENRVEPAPRNQSAA